VANIKKLIGLSDWLTYKLDTSLLEPPEIRVRMRPISGMAPLDAIVEDAAVKKVRLSRIIIDAVCDAVEEWDLSIDGKPLDPTAGNKAVYLVPLLGERVAESGSLLGLELLNYGWSIDNFLGK